MTHIDEVVRLRTRIEELEAEVCWLRDALDPKDGRFRSLQVTPKERVILCRIFDAGPHPVPYESLIAAADLSDTEYAENSVKVFIHRLRKKLRGIGAEIKCVWGVGYLIPPTSRSLLAEIILRENGQ
jgi:DNA-binding response OmpR family regulator